VTDDFVSKSYAASGTSSRQYRNRQGAAIDVKLGPVFRIVGSPQSAVPQEAFTVFGAMRAARSIKMLDLIMLAIGLAFFALSVGYTIACDRL
jgi:hypothetical protein